MSRLWIVGVPVLLFLATVAHATDKTWTGATGNRLMSGGGNWSDGVAPAAGDRLFFPAVPAAQQYVQNDIAGASFDSLYFSGDENVYILYGNAVTLTGTPTGPAVVSASGHSTYFMDLDVTFGNTNVVVETTGLPTPDAQPAIQFTPGTHMTLTGGDVSVSVPFGAIEFASDIAETAQTNFQITGVEVGFSGNNSFTGSVTTFASHFDVSSPNALGTPSFATFVGGLSIMNIGDSLDTGELVIPERFSLMSTYNLPPWGSVVASGLRPIRLTGDIVLLNNQIFQAPNHPLTIDGAISGPGHLEIGRAFNDVVVLTNANNSFTGGLSVTEGTLRAGNSLAFGTQTNDVSVGAGATLDIGQTFQLIKGFSCAGTMNATVSSALLAVRTSLALSNCALNVSMPPGYIPRSQEVMRMVQNDTGSAFNQPFVGYPEGTMINVNGVSARATYLAGTDRHDFAFVAELLPVQDVSVVSGGLQSTALGAVASAAFVAKGLDRYGRPAPNARITFTANACGSFGGAPTATATTDAFGIATAPAFTASNTTQVCNVTATGDAPGASAAFEVHEYAPANVTMTAIPASLSTVINQPFSVAIELRGLNNMSLPGLTVTFQAMPRGNAGVASLDPSAVTNAANSRATANGVANNKSGNYDIVARFGSLSRTIPVSQKAQ